MRKVRVYLDVPLHCGQPVTVPDPAAHHLGKVLRLKPEDAVQLFNGRGGCFDATVRSVGRHDVILEPTRFLADERESALAVTLVQGISRGPRMDYALQKAVELGVTRIVPVLTEHGGVRLDAARSASRMDHWRGILISACVQCGRNRVPELLAPLPAHDWFPADTTPDRIILHPRGTQRLAALRPSGPALSVACGPEGGFSNRELTLAEAAGYRPVRLGPRTLRTETAAVAALTACQILWGDLG